jgi:hypothetical protein
VEFETEDGSWIGNFAPFLRQWPSSLHAEFGPRFVFVVSGGAGYFVDAEQRQLVRETRSDIQHVWFQRELPALVISNGLWFEAFDPQGTLWKSRRVSWDWVRNIRREGLTVKGEASVPTDEWIPFELDLQTGVASGGSYDGLDE